MPRVSPRKPAKPGGRLEGRPTGGEACFIFVTGPGTGKQLTDGSAL